MRGTVIMRAVVLGAELRRVRIPITARGGLR